MVTDHSRGERRAHRLMHCVCIVHVLVAAHLCGRLTVASSLAFQEIPTGVSAGNFAAIAMNDIDGDGYGELVSGRIAGMEGLFLLYCRDSAWTKREVTSVGEYGGLAIVDVTGDGVPDVLAVKTDAKGSPDGLEIFQSLIVEGTARLMPRPSPYTEKACGDLAVGDIERDGDIDVALATRGAGVVVLLNNGDASVFRTLRLQTNNYEDTGIAMGDVNHDGRLDVIATNHPGNNPRLFLCSGSGEVTFDTGHVAGLDISPNIGYEIVVAEFSGDDSIDLLIGTQEGLRLFAGNGCTGLDRDWWQEIRPARAGHQTMQVAAGDINKDGKIDIASASSSGLLILLGETAGRFTRSPAAALPQKGDYSGCCLFDWDGDGDLDVACCSLRGLGVRLFENLLVN